jgi:hypothetical protein
VLGAGYTPVPPYTGIDRRDPPHMAIFVIILLLLALTGTLWAVLKVAVGVAIGVFLGFVLIGGLVGWRIRRAIRARETRWRQIGGTGSSRIEVLDPPPEP